MKDMIKGFNPVFSKSSEILILGSFPSVPSRVDGFYYGNKRNRFWQTLAKIFNLEPPITKEEKIDFILNNNLALWDVVESCDIKGSADANLKNYQVADLFVVLKNANIKAIICNGKKCYDVYTKNYDLPIKVYCLPSTSPANVSFDIQKWEDSFKEILNG